MVIYGIAVVVGALIAWASHDRTTRIMSAILGLEWLICNAAVGHDRFALANPATIATVALAVTIIAKTLPITRQTLFLTGVYGATMLLACFAAFSGLTLERWYFDAINGTFALRLLVVGGWGVWCAIRRGRAVGRDRPLPFPARAATLVRHRPF